MTTVKIGNFQTNVLVDSGASINIIDNDTFNKMNRKKKIKLEKATSKIRTYGSTSKLPIKGKFLAEIESNKKITSAYVYVVEGSSGSLLSCATAHELGLMKLCLNVVSQEGIL